MRQIICADALEWLAANRGVGAVVTSLPDADETGQPVDEWAAWFARAAQACFDAASAGAPVVFYQTDRKAGGRWHSKAAMLFQAAAAAGAELYWHKIILRRGVGKTDLHRPGYTHLMAFGVGGGPGKATPDVMERGRTLYPNGMGLRAARFAVGFAGERAGRVCDPFCGRGTIPAVAEALGYDAIGVDIDPAQCERARSLKLAAA